MALFKVVRNVVTHQEIWIEGRTKEEVERLAEDLHAGVVHKQFPTGVDEVIGALEDSGTYKYQRA